MSNRDLEIVIAGHTCLDLIPAFTLEGKADSLTDPNPEFRADGLSDQQIRECLLQPCHRVEDTLAQLGVGGGSRHPTVCVLPEGPLTIPYVSR